MKKFWISPRHSLTTAGDMFVGSLIVALLYILYYFNQLDVYYTLLIIFGAVAVFIISTPVILLILTLLYPVTLSEQGLRGFKNSGIKKKCAWSDIKSVKIKKPFLFARYIYLYNENGKHLMVIPFNGLLNYTKFSKSVERHIGSEHPLTLCLKRN
jgi:hypothetical protein|tara:strand:+ start:1206 stop:1670 length:465 start_codon:yes stop_codon:yes gene_type:complete